MNTTESATPPPLEEICRRIVARRDDLARLGLRGLSIFGSCSRREQQAGSDIDILVDLKPGHGYFDLARIKLLLETDFDVDVNPVSASAVPAESEIRAGAVHVI